MVYMVGTGSAYPAIWPAA